MNVQSLALLLDQEARAEVDARLYFTQNDGGNQQTTRTVVYATDPLKSISNPFEAIMTVPTDPPSNKVHLIGGHFYANGKLYAVPGMETPEIVLSESEDTYVLVGVSINPKNDKTDLFCETYHGQFPLFDNYIIPSAIIRIPSGKSPIISNYIMDLRPFIHYNVSLPTDRAVVNIACIKPHESAAFELMRGHRQPPIINFYRKLPASGTYTITHEFKSMNDIICISDTVPQYDDVKEAITLKSTTTASPLSMPSTPNVLFVSAKDGRDTNSGTFSDPYRTLESALDRLNGMPGYDTIFIMEGVYTPSRVLEFTKPVTIIGEDPIKCIIRTVPSMPHDLFIFNEEAEVRTIQIQWSVRKDDGYHAVTAKESIKFFNCVFKQGVQYKVSDWIYAYDDLLISNCILHNPYTEIPGTSRSRFYTFEPSWTSPPYKEYFANNIVIGPWNQTFNSGPSFPNLVEDNGDDLGLEDTRKYYLLPGSDGVNHGEITIVGTDTDGTPPDVGLYGGMYASMVRHQEYNIGDIPVFRYAFSTMYSPIISRFVSVDVVTGYIPPDCGVYGAVSFNGGHDWLIWDDLMGAWKRITDLTTLPLTNSTSKALSQHLVDMGPILTKGEIMFAWALKSSVVNATPSIKGVNIVVKASSDTLVPIQPDNFNVVIAEDTMMVTNLSDEQIKDVVIVAY